MNDAPLLPLIGEPIGSAAVDESGGEPSPTGWGQLFRSQLLQTSKELISGISEAGEMLGVSPEEPAGGPTIMPEPPINADFLNQHYQAPGLTFKAPLPASVAEQMQTDQLEANVRRDVAARYEGGFVGRLSASAVAGALDPTNLAASVVPGVGEERIGTLLGLDVAGSLGARVAARAAAGATMGAAAQAPLELLRAAQDPDWQAADIVPDLAGGALLGGAMHAAGTLGDLISTRFAASPEGAIVAANTETDQAATRAAVAQALTGRPVEVEPVLGGPGAAEALQPALRQASGAVPLPEDQPTVAAAAAAPKEEPAEPEAQLAAAHQALTEADAAGRVDEGTAAEWRQAMTDHDLMGQEIARLQAEGLCET